MANEKMVPAHDEIRHLLEVDHYEIHEHRKESEAFRKTKKEMHKEGLKCWVDNGRCSDGPIEIHHAVIEWAAATEIDFEKLQKDYPGFENVDSYRAQMLPLCTKHHREPGFGIHYLTESIFRLQKYMKPDALEKWEQATIKALEAAKHESN